MTFLAAWIIVAPNTETSGAVCQSQSRRRAVPDLYFVWISIFLEYLAHSKMECQNQTKMFFKTKVE